MPDIPGDDSSTIEIVDDGAPVQFSSEIDSDDDVDRILLVFPGAQALPVTLTIDSEDS